MNRLKLIFKLFWVFFKIGAFTFGGGLAMLPLIHKEVVDNHKWISDEDIIDVFAISQSVPGVIAVNTSVFIGKSVAGTWGAVAAAFGVVLPAFASILLILILLSNFENNLYVNRFFMGIKAASAALILLAAIKLGKAAVKGKAGLIIAIASFLAIILLNINAAYAVIAGALTGLFMYIAGRRKNDA